jgi:hypothetical protein
MLVLLPDRRTGWYVAYNADDGEQLAQAVYQRLETHFAPATATPSPGKAVVTAAVDAGGVTGVYRDADYSHRTLAKLLILSWGDYPSVDANADGTLAGRACVAVFALVALPLLPFLHSGNLLGFQW